MSYLFLDFTRNLTDGSNSQIDFFKDSLEVQYKSLNSKFNDKLPNSLQQFIAAYFPLQLTKTYYISMPSFDREIEERKGRKYINNIVIRSEDLITLNKNYQVILIGDVFLGDRITSITIKGIDLIDSAMLKCGEMPLLCNICSAFKTKQINGSFLADFEVRNLQDSALDNNFVNKLCTTVYPVKDHSSVYNFLARWEEYISFRQYYISQQSMESYKFDKVRCIDSYMISKRSFKKNNLSISDIVDNHESFSKREQIAINSNLFDSDSFPLICVEIMTNKKEELNKDKEKKLESLLYKFTRKNLSLSEMKPSYDDKGNKKFDGLTMDLGDKYGISFKDILPNTSKIEEKYKKEIKDTNTDIEDNYKNIIKIELEKLVNKHQKVLNAEKEKEINSYINQLNNELDKDVKDNNDKEIIKKITELVDKEISSNKKELAAAEKKLKDSKAKDKKELKDNVKLLKEKLEKEKEVAYNSINIKQLYVDRNDSKIDYKNKSLTIKFDNELTEYKKVESDSLVSLYNPKIKSEQIISEKQLKEKMNKEIEELIENETIRNYQIYFRLRDSDVEYKDLFVDMITKPHNYLIYNNIAEKAKIDRQQRAINALTKGYIKNPYLHSYLFSSKDLIVENVQHNDIIWYLESLNDKQKEAVRKALSSESIFLLQGPPGTGKTQVIAELTAQFAKSGKKVLISSETHKAIDNVFDRLPKVPEIRPLRLIPNAKKNGSYSPEKLVDNFYKNITNSLDKQVMLYENFEDLKKNFSVKMNEIIGNVNIVNELKKKVTSIEKNIEKHETKLSEKNQTLSTKKQEANILLQDIEKYDQTVKCIENINLTQEDVYVEYLTTMDKGLKKILIKYPAFEKLPMKNISKIRSVILKDLQEELNSLSSTSDKNLLERKRADLKSHLSDLRDPDTGDNPEPGNENYNEYVKVRKELIETSDKIKKLDCEDIDYEDTLSYSLIADNIYVEEYKNSLIDNIIKFNEDLNALISKICSTIEKEKSVIIDKKDSVDNEIDSIKLDANLISKKLDELRSEDNIVDYEDKLSRINQETQNFFKDFNINKEYDHNDLNSLIDIIKEEWFRLETTFDKEKNLNKERIPLYKEICKYLGDEDLLEEDRISYTRKLYDKVNVFGMTSSSRDNFSHKQLENLKKYNIANIDLKKAGIDVVIVDEVSKSSFLDLVLPILYGKTIILVGDHRQLPPMYDLKHLKDIDFENLNEEIITEKKNDQFTTLYEECYFKTIYESIGDGFKVMLNKQYRCHSHIMEVFNHFYGGNKYGLQIGKTNQDLEKQHNLSVSINNKLIIQPKNHIYFFDCDQAESSEPGSSSKRNVQEANVVIKLIKELDAAIATRINNNQIRIDRRNDERPSIGVICTYGDQASLIKQKRKGITFKNFSGISEERFVVSTVDDFQGDERDIIIVSMVRNPKNGKYDANFIKKFERINVALSRARKMLIVVGSKNFLSKAGIIDLPDLSGDESKNKYNVPIYQDIIHTINIKGNMVSASDIIGDDE